jgi:hypothetical protein
VAARLDKSDKALTQALSGHKTLDSPPSHCMLLAVQVTRRNGPPLTPRTLGPQMKKRAKIALWSVGAAVLAASVLLLFVPFVEYRMSSEYRIGRNESSTIAALRAYLDAQHRFIQEDQYGIGKKVYANPRDGAGFADLYQVRYGTENAGPVLGFMDLSFARAGPAGAPKDGYHFADIPQDDYDYTIDHVLAAVPARYGVTGRRVFFIDVLGVIRGNDARFHYPDLKHGDPVPPFNAWPFDPEPWIPCCPRGGGPDRMTGDD